MALTILHAPNELSPVGNPIAYKVETDNPNVSFILMRLYVESAYGTLDFQQIIEQASPPDADRQTTFYIQDVLASCLDATPIDFQTSDMTPDPQLSKMYKVAFAEITPLDNPSNVTYTEYPIRYAILAHINNADYPDSTIISPTNLLTAKPLTRRLAYNQLDFLTVLSPSDAYEVTANIGLYYKDNSTQTIDINFGLINKYQAAIIPTGVPQRNYPSPPDLERIVFTIAGSQVIYQLYEPSDLHGVLEFYYLNRIAGVETLVCDGESEEFFELDKIDFENYIPYNYTAYQSQFAHLANQRKKIAGTVNSGFVPQTEFHAYWQLFESEKVFLKKSGKIYPALIKNKQSPNNKTSEPLKSLNIQYQLAL